ncbi:hypothetical protein AGOR_G00221910 [Albula goreensis]|uniref:AIG1-type G domain-containing protein n=1 Tax=Albula goreensis TaxID=1534307 RepID=A0A8T3CG08_9TELE|nr:hypothetical protein AGOR_G00221910 [Albula goreensis]
MGKGMLEDQPQQSLTEPNKPEGNSDNQMGQSLEITELRLVLLGRTREVFVSGGDGGGAVTQECLKRRGTVAGRRVAVVDTPDWFSSQRPPEELRRQLSACAALAAPGPHAFLLCVPVDRPAQAELQALGSLGEVFGLEAVRGHTLVLFTHGDRLLEGGEAGAEGGVEGYISTCRADLLELVGRCGDRFHVLERGGAGAEGEEGAQGRSVRELLEKVEQTVREAGGEHCGGGLFQLAEARVQERQREIARERRRRERGEGEGEVEEEEGEEEDEGEEWEKARDEAERSAGDLELDGLPTLWVSDSSAVATPSFLLSVWQTLASWIRRALKYIRGGALLGGVVRVLVGGPLGGVLGATVGSVVTEVGKRKHAKKQ